MSCQGPLSIRVEPEPQVVAERGLAVFKVQAVGLEPLTYQWYKDGAKVRDIAYVIQSLPSSSSGAAVTSCWEGLS